MSTSSWIIIILAGVIVILTFVILYISLASLARADEKIIKSLKKDQNTEGVRDLIDSATGAVYVLIERHILDLPRKDQKIIREYIKDHRSYLKLASFIQEAAKRKENNTDTKQWGF